MRAPLKGYSTLATFTAVPFDKAKKRFSLGTDKTDRPPPKGFDGAISDAFGDEPVPVFVHDGSVVHDGDVKVGTIGEYAGVYVIDGDLEVDGVLEVSQCDGAAVVLVTGSVRAKTVAVTMEGQLWIGKDLTATDYVVADLSDAGGLAVKGDAQARAFVTLGRRLLSLGKKAEGPMVERTEGSVASSRAKKYFPKVETVTDALVKPFNTESVNFEKLLKAIRKGTPLLK